MQRMKMRYRIIGFIIVMITVVLVFQNFHKVLKIVGGLFGKDIEFDEDIGKHLGSSLGVTYNNGDESFSL